MNEHGQTMTCCYNIEEIISDRTYGELDLAASHDVIQKGIHFDDLSGGKLRFIDVMESRQDIIKAEKGGCGCA